MADVILGTATDKQGSVVTLKYADSIAGSPVCYAFLKNFVALMDSGFTHNAMAGHNKCRAIYAEIDGQIVGHIVFEILDDAWKTAWITLSTVDSDFRRRGLYGIIHKSFEANVKSRGSKKISSFVHVNNTVRQASCAKIGMKPVYYKMEKDI